jgi:hypothetical protein
MKAGTWLRRGRVLAGTIGALAAAGCAGTGPAVPDLTNAPTVWRMIVAYDGRPSFVPAAELAPAAGHGGIRRLHVLTNLLPKQDGSGRSGWMIATEDYDCAHGSMRTLAQDWRGLDGRPIAPEPGWAESSQFHSIVPGTPPVVRLKAACYGDGGAGSITVTGTPRDIWDHDARQRKAALGY